MADRVRFQRQRVITDDYGNARGEWEALAHAWADIRETPGREAVLAGRVSSPRTATIRVRSTATMRAVTPADRLTARGRTWNILGAGQAPGNGDLIEFLCEEVTG
nr:phage head closure protein [Pseudoroseicyclus aestuarii]